jgi:hypothetical protein
MSRKCPGNVQQMFPNCGSYLSLMQLFLLLVTKDAVTLQVYLGKVEIPYGNNSNFPSGFRC